LGTRLGSRAQALEASGGVVAAPREGEPDADGGRGGDGRRHEGEVGWCFAYSLSMFFYLHMIIFVCFFVKWVSISVRDNSIKFAVY
jgi:hypothetical protein